jgi:hypothetical protein
MIGRTVTLLVMNERKKKEDENVITYDNLIDQW